MSSSPSVWQWDARTGQHRFWSPTQRRYVYRSELPQAQRPAPSASAAPDSAQIRQPQSQPDAAVSYSPASPINIPNNPSTQRRVSSSQYDPDSTPRRTGGLASGLESRFASLSVSAGSSGRVTSRVQSQLPVTGGTYTDVRPGESGGRTYRVTDPSSKVQSFFETDPNNNIIKYNAAPDAQEGDREELDPNYFVRRRPQQFFQRGRVFHMLYAEPAGQATREHTDLTYDSKYREAFHVKPRRLVVIMPNTSSCVALPIHTYEGQGVAKRGVVKSDHVVIYTGRTVPRLTDMEAARREQDIIRPDAIRVDPEPCWAPLHVLSRLNLAKPVTVEHNIKVLDYGMVNQGSIEALVRQFREVWNARLLQPTPQAQPQQQGRPRVDSTQQRGESTQGTHTSEGRKMNEMVRAYQAASRTQKQAQDEVAARIAVKVRDFGCSRSEAIDRMYANMFGDH